MTLEPYLHSPPPGPEPSEPQDRKTYQGGRGGYGPTGWAAGELAAGSGGWAISGLSGHLLLHRGRHPAQDRSLLLLLLPTTVVAPMLHLKDVKKSFSQPDGTELPILDIGQFHMEADEQVVLVGRSGSGKTTLLHVIAGISRPDSGRVRVDGWETTLFSEAECDRFRAERIGYVFQTFNLLPGFSALENVLLAMRFAQGRPDKARAKQLLDRVGLGHRMTHKPAMLSVGEQQRVAVARALANRPKLLLADEPTANVDSGSQQQVLDLIREASAEQKVALLLVTHSPQVAEQFSRIDRLEQINRVSPSGPEG